MREKSAQEIVSEVRSRLASINLGARASVDGVMAWWPGVNSTIEYKDSYTVGDFLRYSDSVLVEAAYRCILKRPPDPEGLAHHAAKLRSGETDVIDLLAGFRWSPEGEVHRVHIDGLLLPTKLRQWGKLPLLGRVIRWGHGLYRLGSVDRRASASAARQAYEFKELGDHLNRLVAQISSRLAANAELSMSAEAHASRAISNIERTDQAINDVEEAFVARSHAAELQIQQANAETTALRSMIANLEKDLVHGKKLAGAVADELRKHEDNAARLGADVVFLSSRHEAFARELLGFRQLATEVEGARAILERHKREQDAAAEAERRLDSLYVEFESKFRGDSALLRTRMLPYIDSLKEAGVLDSGLPVLDVACGNGEWLQILREHEIAACGVDSNGTFVGLCKSKGLDVHAMDALEFLKRQPESVYSAVTSMHLVEHLALADLVALLDEAHRTLQPGGLLILETPNPENFMVSSIDFYNDPTHRNPIPPNTLKWMVEARGFKQARIERLTAGRDWGAPELLDPALPGANSINQLLDRARAAPDYAVIGVKM